ncbi:MAG: hypothetical protein QF824_01250 [Candidatus Woesearchaeota archaeon]|jgi:NOL1/NOP2/fmu family ribosome biogenesis protein|nr:hypothetical protein [Candidatus Woesearchaeota archaeon]
MQNIKILNKKEIKQILSLVEQQWGPNIDLDYVFLQNTKNKIYIVNKDISKLNLDNLRINSLGLYFAELNHNQLRLSFEGAQIIGPTSKKNVLELDDNELKQWLKGEDLDKETKLKGYQIIKNKEDFYGCGKVINNKLLNHVPKIRRISAIN